MHAGVAGRKRHAGWPEPKRRGRTHTMGSARLGTVAPARDIQVTGDGGVLLGRCTQVYASSCAEG